MADDNKDLVRLRQIFSANLNYYMELTKKSRDDICKALKVPYMTVSDWCRIIRESHAQTLLAHQEQNPC